MLTCVATSQKRLLQNTFVIGVVFSLLVAAADGLLTRAGIGKDLLRLVFMAAVDGMLLWLIAESCKATIRTLAMFAGGGTLGAAYFIANYANQPIYISASGSVDYIYYFAYAVILAPIFEEAIVRRWMYFGAAQWMGWFASALLVSTIFALTHRDMQLFAFGFSLLMCYMAFKGVKTLDRAVFHGSHSLILQGLLVFYAT
ncbi:MAG: CPBP family intramembrane glutamic endopeptidase [Rudaea sp.]